MGNKPAQPYGALTNSPKFSHTAYFKSKGPVLLACILQPEEAGVADSSLHRLLVVTRSGFHMYNLRSGHLLRSLSIQVLRASVGVAITQRKTIALVDSKSHLQVYEASQLKKVLEVPSEEEVSVLKMLADGYLVYGSASGKVRMVSAGDGAVQVIPCEIQAKVLVLHQYKALEKDAILAGFEADSTQKSSLFLFNHVRASNPFQQALIYPGLAGSCGDIAVIDNESVILALTKGTATMSVWDLESCGLLLTLDLAQNTQISRILVIGESTPTGKVRLALAGSTGLITGIFEIGEEHVNWTQKAKSETSTAKTKPGAATSLEFEMTMHLLVYGDDKGQTWVLEGPAPIVEQLIASPEQPHEAEVDPQEQGMELHEQEEEPQAHKEEPQEPKEEPQEEEKPQEQRVEPQPSQERAS